MPEVFTTALTTIWSQIDSCVSTITGNAVLSLGVAIPVAGGVIGLAKRLLHFGGRRRQYYCGVRVFSPTPFFRYFTL